MRAFTPPKTNFISNTSTGIYIHIPYCSTICYYCNFCKQLYNPEQAPVLVQALLQELEAYINQAPDLRIHSIYIGGGTPSTLKPAAIAALLTRIRSGWDCVSNCEITLEMNPDHVSDDWLPLILETGITRVSLGAQSNHAYILAQLGRHHTWERVLSAIQVLRQVPISINSDLLYGMPDLNHQALLQSLTAYSTSQSDHITVYSLIIEPGTPFYKCQQTRTVDEMASDYTVIDAVLCQAGFEAYDTAAFAKPGHIAWHNCAYWHFYPYIGIGPGSHSFFRGHRFRHPPTDAYIQNPIHASLQTSRPVPMQDRFEEWVMLGLRTRYGLDLDTAAAWFPTAILKYHALIQTGYLTQDKTRIIATRKGRRMLDSLAVMLLE